MVSSVLGSSTIA
uniref:Uncharacterized protein n=1 Tax=Arundo donax TaxID=35708 RepID=A0A0A9GV18_ARUDO